MKHSSFVRIEYRCLFHMYGFKFNEFGDIWYFADLKLFGTESSLRGFELLKLNMWPLEPRTIKKFQ